MGCVSQKHRKVDLRSIVTNEATINIGAFGKRSHDSISWKGITSVQNRSTFYIWI